MLPLRDMAPYAISILCILVSFISHRPDREGTLTSDLKWADARAPRCARHCLTCILCKQQLLFWMRVITINHLTALKRIHNFVPFFIKIRICFTIGLLPLIRSERGSAVVAVLCFNITCHSLLYRNQSNHVKEPYMILPVVIMVLLRKLRLKYGYYTTTTETFHKGSQNIASPQ